MSAVIKNLSVLLKLKKGKVKRFSAVVSRIIPHYMYECVKQIIINRRKINDALNDVDIRVSDAKQKVKRLNYKEYEDIVKFYVSEKLYQKHLDEAYKPGADWEIILNKTWASFKELAYKNEIEECSKFLDNFFFLSALAIYQVVF